MGGSKTSKHFARLWSVIGAGYVASLANGWICLAWIEASATIKFGALLFGGLVIGASACRIPLFSGRRKVLAVSAFMAALT